MPCSSDRDYCPNCGSLSCSASCYYGNDSEDRYREKLEEKYKQEAEQLKNRYSKSELTEKQRETDNCAIFISVCAFTAILIIVSLIIWFVNAIQ